ncbi:hypothetical protein [Streptomyces sp. NPDC046909]|uniref:hypothetical protein n=1 Tax=Streptomyces sp. NPDC046909 TaxID=3155617 RepID=UPI003410CEB5
MTEFSESKAGYRTAARAWDEGRDAVVAAAERVKALERALREAARRPSDIEAELQRALRQARADAGAARRRLVGAKAAMGEAMGAFSGFADPVKGVQHLTEDMPIALFPLRLETRYKQVPHGDGTEHQQLWVRAFPDDILVDSFQPEISRAELDNLRIYWTHRWRAGGNPQGLRAAWLALARSHGAGRAQWLLGRYTPVNAADEPVAAEGDHLLVIRTETPVPADQLDEIGAYWARVWSSGGAEAQEAYDDLRDRLGRARADEVVSTLVPVNLHDVEVRPDESTTPRVVVLHLPDPSGLPVSAEDWTRGARAWMLPERLVVVGFRAGGEVFRQVGLPIPPDLGVGPDPSDAEEGQIKADGTDITASDAIDWTVDFRAAVDKGMGIVVDLTERGVVDPRLDRLFVLGLRLASDAAEGAAELETLIGHHQAGRQGFTLLRQGQATNNTEESRAGYSWWEDNNAAYDHFHPDSPPADPADGRERRDGAWLAGLLGIDPEVLKGSPGYFGSEQSEARAMNVALWPATLGYFMEQMMEPVFSDRTVERTREFFCRHVIGRGTTPLVRVGRQPYGFLPATAWSRMAFAGRDRKGAVRGDPGAAYLTRLHSLVERAVRIWSGLAADVSHVGGPGADPQQTLLDLLGLHPVSVEFFQRYSQSFTQYYNLLGLASEPVGAPVTDRARRQVEEALAALAQLGWAIPAESDLPALLDKVFLASANLLTGDLVSVELSETEGLPVERADGLDYIKWLLRAARTSHDALRKQEGFLDGVPTALLYQMLHHSLDLGYVDCGLVLRREALQWDDVTFRAQRKEPIHLAVTESGAAASRWAPLYRAEEAVTGDPGRRLGDFIPSVIEPRGLFLAEQLRALDLLDGVPTARLERALVEHLDCLNHRLDAWRLGLSSVRLAQLRQESDEGFARRGIHLGAYGWLEDLAPSRAGHEPVELDRDLAAVFDGTEPLVRDDDNLGHVHAPSLDQAVTAAILRAGHLAHGTPGAPDLLAIDLSSERVRLAEEVIEGMRDGQSLGALLGYRLERALHDEPSLFLDRIVYGLRRAFPLRGNRNRTTRVPTLTRIQQVEARNVLDGAALSRHIDEKGVETYPYDVDGLPPLSDFTGPGLPTEAEIGRLVDDKVALMRSIADAVADLAVAEGVYQMVRGNHDKAAGSMDAFSKGNYPPTVEVATTPRSGRALTHRVGLHLAAGLLPGAGGLTHPREQGEPALAQWVSDQLPGPASVTARVSWSRPGGTTSSLDVSMQQLGLAAVDLFYLIDAAGGREMSAFDELLIDYACAHAPTAPHDDAVFTLHYRLPGIGGTTLFEIAPLVRALRGFVLGSRPLRATDLSLQNEASRADDRVLVPRTDKVTAVRDLLSAQQAPIEDFITTLEAAVGDEADVQTACDAARDSVDQWVADYSDRVRPLVPFGLRAGGLAAPVEGRRARYSAMQQALGGLADRWTRYAGEFDAVMADYAALPGTATDDDRRALLLRAVSLVSTAVIAPVPVGISDLEDRVALVRGDFDSARSALEALRSGHEHCGGLLRAITGFRTTVAAHDLTPFDIEPFRRSVLALARDLLARTRQLSDDVDTRLKEADKALADASLVQGDKAHQALVRAQQAVLGQDFVLLPEFGLPPAVREEWRHAWADRSAILEHLTTPADGTPFPFDDWLNGVARVRERMRHLETAAMLGPVLGAGSLELAGVQFPYLADDVWLGLDFPGTFRGGRPFAFDSDKLLYTAHFATGALIDPDDPAQNLCGLLVDEWVEVVPGTAETTGLSFHYDRPGSEAPQAVLLVTPPVPGAAWQWQDIVDTLHETLDLARLRAVEPDQLAQTPLGPLLPAVLASVTLFPITASRNFAVNSELHLVLAEDDDE